jgi:hypothetical protein
MEEACYGVGLVATEAIKSGSIIQNLLPINSRTISKSKSTQTRDTSVLAVEVLAVDKVQGKKENYPIKRIVQ